MHARSAVRPAVSVALVCALRSPAAARIYLGICRRWSVARTSSKPAWHIGLDPWDIDAVAMPPYFQFPDDEEDTHPHVVTEQHKVPMRDGVKLATTVYRPSWGADVPVLEPLPVLLHRTPYNKDKSARTERCLLPDGSLSEPIENPYTADRFARRGYVVVLQDCRGRYQSEGRFTKYVNEGDDGQDTLAWMTAQPWCNGKVGTFGLSYCAHVQLALACKKPPGLACMFLESGGFFDAYQDGVRYAGVFTMKQVTWAVKNAKVSPEVMRSPERLHALEAMDLHDWFKRVHEWLPGYSPLSLAPDYESYIFNDWAAQYDGELWQRVGLAAAHHLQNMSDVPTLIICSWYDPYIGSMTELFAGLRRTKRSAIRMVLGPWTHGDRAITYAGEVDFGPHCTFDRNVAPTFQAARAAWFDEFLHGRPPGGSPTPGTSPLPGNTPPTGMSPVLGSSPAFPPASPLAVSSVVSPRTSLLPPATILPHSQQTSQQTSQQAQHMQHSFAAQYASLSTPIPASLLTEAIVSRASGAGTTAANGTKPYAGDCSMQSSRAASTIPFGTSPNAHASGLAFFRPSLERESSILMQGSSISPGQGRAGPLMGVSPKAAGVVISPFAAAAHTHGPDTLERTSCTSTVAPWRQPQAPVKYFRMGGGSGKKNAAGRLDHGGQWKVCKHWPPDWAQHTAFCLLKADGHIQLDADESDHTAAMPEGDEGEDSEGPSANSTLMRPVHSLTHWHAQNAPAGPADMTHASTPSSYESTLRQDSVSNSSRGASAVPSPGSKSAGDLPQLSTAAAALRLTESSAATGPSSRPLATSAANSETSLLDADADVVQAKRTAATRRALLGEGSSVVLTHNPLHPVPTIGGNITSGEPIMSGGGYDQVERPNFFGCDPQHYGRRLCDRPDVHSWSTPPLDCDVELTGSVHVVLAVSSDAPDADLHVTLVDEYPPNEDCPHGFGLNVASGIARARFRNGHLPHQVSWLEPGEVSKICVHLNVTSNLFKKGHRLRLDVSASSFPRYEINYGVTDDEHQAWLQQLGDVASCQGAADDDGDAGGMEKPLGNSKCCEEAAGYAPLQHAPLSADALTALKARMVANGVVAASVPDEKVLGRPYRVCTHRIHYGTSPETMSHIELPVRRVEEGEDDGGSGSLASPSTPLIPFSRRWLQRRPTWSR